MTTMPQYEYHSQQCAVPPAANISIDTSFRLRRCQWHRASWIRTLIRHNTTPSCRKRPSCRRDVHRRNITNTQHPPTYPTARYPQPNENAGHHRAATRHRTPSTSPSALLRSIPVSSPHGPSLVRSHPVRRGPERSLRSCPGPSRFGIRTRRPRLHGRSGREQHPADCCKSLRSSSRGRSATGVRRSCWWTER